MKLRAIKSLPVKSSNGRRRASKNSSKTPSTPAPVLDEVEIADGGQSYMRVTDDGCGMSAEDAKMHHPSRDE